MVARDLKRTPFPLIHHCDRLSLSYNKYKVYNAIFTVTSYSATANEFCLISHDLPTPTIFLATEYNPDPVFRTEGFVGLPSVVEMPFTPEGDSVNGRAPATCSVLSPYSSPVFSGNLKHVLTINNN
jgi:hypothetical protein